MKTPILLSLLIVTLCTNAFADGSNLRSRGDLLKDRQYRTNSNISLFVDPTGNDANACTSTGTAACLTIQAALNKSPKLLRHQLTVTVAAGNYAGFTVSGFTMDPSIQKTTGGILIDGVLGNVTPTTGSATGTATAGSAGSGTTYGTLTDSGATWTVNDTALVGKLIVITGGTGSGQVKIIVSNTATVLTIAGTWTAPTGTSTYAIQTPTSIVNSTTPAIVVATGTTLSAANVQVFNNNLGGGSSSTNTGLIIRNMGIVVANSAQGILTSGSTSTTLLQNVITAGTSTVAMTATQGASLTMAQSSFITLATAGPSAVGGGSLVTLNNSYINITTSASNQARLQVTSSQYKGAGSSGFTVATGATATLGTSRCDCLSTASSSCIFVSGGAGPATTSQINVTTGLDVANCTNGANSRGGFISFGTSAGAFTGNALSYAAVADYGGSVWTPSAPAITSGTADMLLDGVNTAAFSSLAASYSCFASPSSKICRL